MPRNLTGETYALKRAAELKPRIWGPGRPFNQWWPEIETRLAEFSAIDTPLVRRIADGSLPRSEAETFVKDLVVLSKDLPLHQTRFAARANFHGEDTVLIMSHAPALALGYAGFRFMPELAREFAQAFGVAQPDLESHRLSRWPAAYLNGLYDYGNYPEMGIASTLVDVQWEPIAKRLQVGFQKHYSVSADKTEIFDAFAAMDGPRAKMRPVILDDMARSAYHQSMVRKAVITITSLWRRMWESWENPQVVGFTLRPHIGGETRRVAA
jgi:hypothetical protein